MKSTRARRREKSIVHQMRRAALSSGPRPGEPSLEEIATECLKIQAGWSEQERERRASPELRSVRWTVPTVAIHQE